MDFGGKDNELIGISAEDRPDRAVTGIDRLHVERTQLSPALLDDPGLVCIGHKRRRQVACKGEAFIQHEAHAVLAVPRRADDFA